MSTATLIYETVNIWGFQHAQLITHITGFCQILHTAVPFLTSKFVTSQSLRVYRPPSTSVQHPLNDALDTKVNCS